MSSSLTPDSSPAGDTDKKPKIFMAGEGSSGERRRSPLSYTLPLQIIPRCLRGVKPLFLLPPPLEHHRNSI